MSDTLDVERPGTAKAALIARMTRNAETVFGPLSDEAFIRALTAIEREAVADYRKALAERVRAADFTVSRTCTCHEGEKRRAYEPDEYRAAVLALIEQEPTPR